MYEKLVWQFYTNGYIVLIQNKWVPPPTQVCVQYVWMENGKNLENGGIRPQEFANNNFTLKG